MVRKRRKKATKQGEEYAVTLEEIKEKFERTRSGSLYLSPINENKTDQQPDWWNNVGEKPFENDGLQIADIATNGEQPTRKIIADSPKNSVVVTPNSGSVVSKNKLVRRLETKLMKVKNRKTMLEKN